MSNPSTCAICRVVWPRPICDTCTDAFFAADIGDDRESWLAWAGERSWSFATAEFRAQFEQQTQAAYSAVPGRSPSRMRRRGARR